MLERKFESNQKNSNKINETAILIEIFMKRQEELEKK